jgi:formylmethanofuran dehydrogenase subunit B
MSPWICPFCALHCDDLLAGADGPLRIDPAPATGTASTGASASPGTAAQCPRARALLDRARPAHGEPMIDGAPASHDAAVAAAVAMMRTWRRPLFAGLAADVHGQRALAALAVQQHAVVDHAHGEPLTATLNAMQDRGAFTVTLHEARERADVLLFVGDVPEAMPRLLERLGLAGGTGAGAVGTPVDPTHARRAFTLGRTPRATAALAAAGLPATAVATTDDLYDSVAALSAAVAGHAEVASTAVAALATALQGARYAALVWATAELPGRQRALLVEALDRVVKRLNRTTRAGAVMLAPPDGALGAQHVQTWRSGLPLRSAYHPAGVRHAPHQFATRRLLDDRAVDGLLWVSAFDVLPPPATDLPTVVIGHPALGALLSGRAGTVFVPAAVPGVHAGGHVLRTDVVVTLPLLPLAGSAGAWPTVAAVAEALALGLADARQEQPA